MKKILTITLLFIIFLLISLIIYQQNNKKDYQESQNANIMNDFSTYSFYNPQKKEEYLKYQNETGYSPKQTILYVNIGLNYPFYTHTKLAKNQNSLTILVNKYNYLTKDYFPHNLMSVSKYAKDGVALRSEAIQAFLEMAQAMEKENLHIRIISGYRSYNYQEDLYNNYLKDEPEEVVDTYSARPGYSEHQTGLAMDVDNNNLDYSKFHLTKEYNWMLQNAHKYGFILRYPRNKEQITGYKFEPWHYRYVGKDIAKYVYENDLTYEEYYYQFIETK